MSNPWTVISIAAVLGFVIGLLGGGGGILAVPLLIAAGQTFLVASSQSLIIVGAAAVAALVPHHRARRVDWKVGLLFGSLGAAGAIVGARLAQVLDPALLLGALTLLLVGGAFTMLRAASRERARALVPAAAHVEMAGGAVAPELPGTSAMDLHTGVSGRLRLVALASSVGLVTGLLGVGAGFVVVPALVAAMKLPVKKATATALVVIVINSAVAAVVRHDSLGTFDVAVGLAVAAAAFAVGGALLSRRIPGWILSGAFGSLMVLVAVYTVARSVTGG
ncbi:MAG: sulfite exporter TauE/SafE family protein [Actinomycetales bacterium]|nr:sulfite exporter TauE/SafE family protein [Actinomycetales bacterium]